MIITRINRLQDSFRFRLSEWMLAGCMLSWGWILLLPYPTFDLPTFKGMAAIAPEDTWGVACLILGGLRIAVLAINGAWIRSTHGRTVTAFLSCFVWCQIDIGLFNSGAVTPGNGIYLIFLAADCFNIYKCATEARGVDEARRNGSGH